MIIVQQHLILILSGCKTTYRCYMHAGKASCQANGVHSIKNFVFKISMKSEENSRTKTTYTILRDYFDKIQDLLRIK